MQPVGVGLVGVAEHLEDALFWEVGSAGCSGGVAVEGFAGVSWEPGWQPAWWVRCGVAHADWRFAVIRLASLLWAAISMLIVSSRYLVMRSVPSWIAVMAAFLTS